MSYDKPSATAGRSEGDTTSPTAEPRREGDPVRVVVQSLGHPLMLLFIGSLITYIVAPLVIDGINATKMRQEAKQKKALEIWARNTEFNVKLNALKTMLDSYHKQNVRLHLSPAELAEAQREFRREFNKRYLELDEIAWWWYADFQREAGTLGLVPKDQLAPLSAEFGKYSKNVNDSIGLLRPLWQMHTSSDYHPDKQETIDKFDELRRTADFCLSPLFNERSEIIERVADNLIAPDDQAASYPN